MRFFYAIAGVFFFLTALPARERSDSIIRIGIVENAESFNLGCEDSLTLVELNTGVKKNLDGRSVYLVRTAEGKITVGNLSLESPVRVMSIQKGKFLIVIYLNLYAILNRQFYILVF